MTEWTQEILKQLTERDELEKKDSLYYNAFKQLSQVLEDSNIDTNSVDLTNGTGTGTGTGTGSGTGTGTGTGGTGTGTSTTSSTTDNANAKLIQKINTLHLELESAEAKLTAMTKQNRLQNKENTSLKAKVDSLNWEISEKNRAIETVNDELLSCNIQNNVMNDRVKLLTQENESLVKRWMERVKKDAEQINDANELIESLQKKQ